MKRLLTSALLFGSFYSASAGGSRFWKIKDPASSTRSQIEFRLIDIDTAFILLDLARNTHNKETALHKHMGVVPASGYLDLRPDRRSRTAGGRSCTAGRGRRPYPAGWGPRARDVKPVHTSGAISPVWRPDGFAGPSSSWKFVRCPCSSWDGLKFLALSRDCFGPSDASTDPHQKDEKRAGTAEL
jgi:hypothetical protein